MVPGKKEAANLLRITAEDLIQLEIADYEIPEPAGGAHNSLSLMSQNIATYIFEALQRISQKEPWG